MIERDGSLESLPILKCWPEDGGRYITLPLVFTKDPETGARNIGTYRMQVFDGRSTGMHWQRHKGGAQHYRVAERLGKRMPVAVALGPDPALAYSATAPMPEGLDELMLAGFLRRERVELVKCVTIDLEVPANAQIILEGYVEPGERRLEGPFGDHTGFYSHPDDYPVFHLTCITRRKRPVYLTTIVGIPPMEDYYLGKASERIFLPLIRKTLPEIVDMHFPAAGIFHNLVLVSIDKRYPGHARKIMNAFWGLGQLMFSKTIIVVDKDVDVQNEAEVAWIVGTHYDPERDIQFTRGPVDDLEDASDLPALGSKMGIDATRKWPSEGFKRQWPTKISASPAAASDGRRPVGEDSTRLEMISETEAQELLVGKDLIAIGMKADDVRRRLRGTQTTFVRVFEIHVDAPATSLPARTSAGEFRIVGTPRSLEAAIGAVRSGTDPCRHDGTDRVLAVRSCRARLARRHAARSSRRRPRRNLGSAVGHPGCACGGDHGGAQRRIGCQASHRQRSARRSARPRTAGSRSAERGWRDSRVCSAATNRLDFVTDDRLRRREADRGDAAGR